MSEIIGNSVLQLTSDINNDHKFSDVFLPIHSILRVIKRSKDKSTGMWCIDVEDLRGNVYRYANHNTDESCSRACDELVNIIANRKA